MNAINDIGCSIVWFFTEDDVARVIALFMWLFIFGLLCRPAYRRLFGTPEVTDDLLFAAWLLMMNRVAFSVQALIHNDTWGDFTRWFSIGAGIFYAFVVWPYANRTHR